MQAEIASSGVRLNTHDRYSRMVRVHGHHSGEWALAIRSRHGTSMVHDHFEGHVQMASTKELQPLGIVFLLDPPTHGLNIIPFASMAGGWLGPLVMFWLYLWGPLRPFAYPSGNLLWAAGRARFPDVRAERRSCESLGAPAAISGRQPDNSSKGRKWEHRSGYVVSCWSSASRSSSLQSHSWFKARA